MTPEPTPAQAAAELTAETQEHEALAEVLSLVAHWVDQAELGLADTGDLVWRLRQAGYPLPEVGDEDDQA